MIYTNINEVINFVDASLVDDELGAVIGANIISISIQQELLSLLCDPDLKIPYDDGKPTQPGVLNGTCARRSFDRS